MPEAKRPAPSDQPDDLVARLLGGIEEDEDRAAETAKPKPPQARARAAKPAPAGAATHVAESAGAAVASALDTDVDELKQRARKTLPNVMVSLLLHAIIVVLLGFIVLFRFEPSPDHVIATEIVYEYVREELGEEDTEAEEEAADEAAPPTPVEAPETEVLHDEGPVSKVVSETVTNRFGKAREDALRRFGGSPGSERAVKQGLRWLALHQDPNGGWNPYAFHLNCPPGLACRGAGHDYHGDLSTGVTALALLAFTGNGQTPERGEFKDNVARAARAILAAQDSTGCYGRGGQKYMYNHAVALLAVIELYGVTGEAAYAESAMRGLSFLALAQQARDGGWDYVEAQGRRSDASVSGWCILALKSARAAGLEVPEAMWDGSLAFIESMTEPDGSLRYATAGSSPRTEKTELSQRGIALVSVGLASRLFLGQPRDHPLVRVAAERVRAELPDRTILEVRKENGHDEYYWYYGTLAMFQMGGSMWRTWNERTRDMLVDLQRLDTHEAGSWDPPTGTFGTRECGRVYSTAIAVLILETYYRYLPLYALLDDAAGDESGAESPASTAPVADDAIDFAKIPELAEPARVLETGTLLEKVRVVRDLGGAAAPEAAALLRRTWATSTDRNVRVNVLGSLALLGGVESYGVFLAALGDPDAKIVDAALAELPRLVGDETPRDLEAWRAFLAAAPPPGVR